MKLFLKKHILYIAWIQSITATLGSLYYSEIRHFPPCALCWYQRIFLFPLVILIAVGILRKDKKLYLYVLPMSIIGSLIALYQVLLQKGVIPAAAVPCTLNVSCTTSYVTYFGFITIPILSFITFVIITVYMLIYKNLQ